MSTIIIPFQRLGNWRFQVATTWWGGGGLATWHPVGGDQGCCSIPHNAQDNPHHKELFYHVSRVKVGKPILNKLTWLEFSTGRQDSSARGLLGRCSLEARVGSSEGRREGEAKSKGWLPLWETWGSHAEQHFRVSSLKGEDTRASMHHLLSVTG